MEIGSLFYMFFHTILYRRLLSGYLLQGMFAFLLVQFFETIETITVVTHNLASLRMFCKHLLPLALSAGEG